MTRKAKTSKTPPEQATLVAARAAIDALFSDTSVSVETTGEALEDLRGHIDGMHLDALREDRRRAGRGGDD